MEYDQMKSVFQHCPLAVHPLLISVLQCFDHIRKSNQP